MDISHFGNERTSVAEFMRRLYDRQLTTASGGNISLRIDEELFCITPSALDKGLLEKDQIAVVSLEGENLTPHLKLSIEADMHRLILRARPDVKAVFHAHPTYASAFTAISRDGKPVINTRLLAESYFILEDPVFVEYRLMGTDDLARLTAEKAKNHDVLLLENHGVVCLGKSMLEGFDKIELLERAAQMTLATVQMREAGYTVSSLTESRMKQLMVMKGKA
ncbi:MAG: class II aldolase/adducin family protein [Sphaerochaeta sp.]|jgi:L-fuculose-phosphate aldolase